MKMNIPERKRDEKETTTLEKVYMAGRDETIYHWFLAEDIPQEEAADAARDIFGLRNNVDIIQEDMFYSVTIMFPGEDNMPLESRHKELLERL